jgi:hypothetical protein
LAGNGTIHGYGCRDAGNGTIHGYYRHHCCRERTAATYLIKFDAGKGADVGDVFCVAHFSLHSCSRADHSAIDEETLAQMAC